MSGRPAVLYISLSPALADGRSSFYSSHLDICSILFDTLRILNRMVAADSIISQEDSKINLELKLRLLHSSVRVTLTCSSNVRWTTGVYDDGSDCQGTDGSGSYTPIDRDLGLDWRYPLHILILDLCLPLQEWFISLQIILLAT